MSHWRVDDQDAERLWALLEQLIVGTDHEFHERRLPRRLSGLATSQYRGMETLPVQQGGRLYLSLLQLYLAQLYLRMGLFSKAAVAAFDGAANGPLSIYGPMGCAAVLKGRAGGRKASRQFSQEDIAEHYREMRQGGESHMEALFQTQTLFNCKERTVYRAIKTFS